MKQQRRTPTDDPGFRERVKGLARELKNHRESAGLTQTQLARRVGKSTATISKIESAKQVIDMRTFLAITDVLRVAPEQVLMRVEMSRKSLTPLQREIRDVFKRMLERA